VSGATGAAGGGAAAGRQQPTPSTTTPEGPGTSVMPAVAESPAPGGAPAGVPVPPRPAEPPAAGYSPPTTYQKGQPTDGRGVSTAKPARAAKKAAPPRQAGPGGTVRPPAARPAGGTSRRARLRVARADPWSVMKVSFLLAVALGIVTLVGVALLWMVLDAAGVFSSVSYTLTQATGSDTGGGFNLQSYLSFGNVMLFTTLIAVVEIVLATALATLGAFIYNFASDFAGGVEVTLAEEE